MASAVSGDSAAVISDKSGEGGSLKEEEGKEEEGEGGGDKWKKIRKGMDKEFLVIAFPAFVQFSAEPLAALVNTSQPQYIIHPGERERVALPNRCKTLSEYHVPLRTIYTVQIVSNDYES